MEQAVKTIEANFDTEWLTVCTKKSNKSCQWNKKDCIPDNFESFYECQSHDFFEFFIVLDGVCNMCVEKDIIRLERGNMCIIAPQTLHSEIPIKDTSYLGIWSSFGYGRVITHISGKDSSDGYRTFLGRDISCNMVMHKYLLDLILLEHNEKKFGSINMVKAYTYQLVIGIMRNLKDITDSNTSDTSVEKELWMHDVVKEIMEFIERNITKNLTVKEISQKIAVSEHYLCAIFKSVTKKTLFQYINEFKIEKAISLLNDKNLSIKEIASSLGYCDQYYFSRYFKKNTGYSPSEYRKIMNKKV